MRLSFRMRGTHDPNQVEARGRARSEPCLARQPKKADSYDLSEWNRLSPRRRMQAHGRFEVCDCPPPVHYHKVDKSMQVFAFNESIDIVGGAIPRMVSQRSSELFLRQHNDRKYLFAKCLGKSGVSLDALRFPYISKLGERNAPRTEAFKRVRISFAILNRRKYEGKKSSYDCCGLRGGSTVYRERRHD